MNRLWLAIKTWCHLHWHARATAIVLDDCTRVMGMMDQLERPKNAPKDWVILWTMPYTKRSELINRACWQALPKWKWRDE